MNKKWRVIYYETVDGSCDVERFIASLSERNKAKVLVWIESLEERGPHLPRPYADLLEDGIHELRVKLSGGQYRILYFFCHGDYIILSHSFLKVTEQVPKSEIRKAQAIRADFVKRFDSKRLKEMLHEDV